MQCCNSCTAFNAIHLDTRLHRLHALILVYQAASVYNLPVMLFVTHTCQEALKAPCTDKSSIKLPMHIICQSYSLSVLQTGLSEGCTDSLHRAGPVVAGL